MPELPEVETIRRTLTPVVLNQVIVKCETLYPRVFPKNTVAQFEEKILNRKILDLKRRGKYLLFKLDAPEWMVIHLRMTGQLVFSPIADLPLHKQTAVRFWFNNGGELRFVDQRRFGTIYLLSEADFDQIHGLHTLGPEPLTAEFTPEALANNIKSVSPIKNLLLNQAKVAGLGNIYVDEALFRAGTHPLRSGNTLTSSEITILYQSIEKVLTEAIASQGTTIKDYRTGSGDTGNFQNKLEVYRRTGEPCPRCGTKIARTKVSGRSTHFCPSCQRCDQDCGD